MKRLLIALLLLTATLTAAVPSDTLSSATCPGTGCQSTTVTGLGVVTVQVTGTFVGILVFEASADGTNFVGTRLTGDSGSVASTQAAGMWSGSVVGVTSFRVRFASYTSGSAVVTTNTGVNTAAANAVTGTFFQATQPVSVAATLTTQMAGWSFSNITTNATTVVKSGAGVLHCVTVNTLGTTSSAVLYDNTAASGTKIGTVTTLIAGQAGCYDAAFATGLTVVTAGAAAADITVSYR